jgi:hypothetical protein
MPKFNNNQLIAQFQDFRQKIYNCFESCSDACMDLLDALAGNTGANSIAELSLNPLFPRSYNSIYQERQRAGGRRQKEILPPPSPCDRREQGYKTPPSIRCLQLVGV